MWVLAYKNGASTSILEIGHMSLSAILRASGVLFALLGMDAALAQKASPPVATPNGVASAAAVGAAAPPRCDANCVRANAGRASEICAPKIEAKAPGDFEWISRPTPGIFQQADPSSPANSVVRYRGDSVRFTNAQNGWVRVSYECAYDVDTQTVVSVKVHAGRLDQPLGLTQPISAAAAIPAVPQASQLPAQKPAQSVVTQQVVSQQKPKPRPRVWEPSPVEIQQQSPNPRRRNST